MICDCRTNIVLDTAYLTNSDIFMKSGVAIIADTLNKIISRSLEARIMTDKDRKPDDPVQSKRFIESAREAEADETEKGADKAFKKIVGKKRISEDPT